MNGFHFLRPWALLLLPLAAFVLWRFSRSTDPLRGWRSQMDADLLDALRAGEGLQARMNLIRLSLMVLLGILIVAGPVWRITPSPFAEDQAVLVVLMDCSEDMGAAPPDPSALLQAQLKLEDLLKVRGDGKTALVAYSGTAHLVLPPTEDRGVLLSMARELSPDIMPRPGRDLTAAIRQAHTLLQAGPGSILIMTDRVEDSPESLGAVWQELGRPDVQLYSVVDPVDPGLRAVAKQLQAPVRVRTHDDEDVRALVNGIKRQVRQTAEEEGAQWQEDAWWLMLPLAGLFLAGCRREASA